MPNYSRDVGFKLTVSVMALLTVLPALLITTGMDCPVNCECEDKRSAECKGGSEAPKGFNPNITRVVISQTKIPILHNNSLDTNNFHKLEDLVITFCDVETVTANAFTEIEELTFLDLSNNDITYLAKDAFTFNSKLKILILDSNPLVTLGDAFLQSGSLRHLRMINCDIADVTSAAFAGLPKLSKLNLRENQLEYLSPTTFENLKELQILDLRENQWHCNCALKPLIDWLLHDLKGNPLYPNCTFPRNVMWNETQTIDLCFFNETTVPLIISTDIPNLSASRNLTATLNVSMNSVNFKEEITVLKEQILLLTDQIRTLTIIAYSALVLPFVIIACVIGYLHRRDIKHVFNHTSNDRNERLLPDNGQ